MSRILFTHSYFYKFDQKQWDTKQPYPPLGTLYAAAVLRESGFDVALFDTNLAGSPAEIIPALIREKPAYLVIYDDGFNYLTKMCLSKMRRAAFQLAGLGKASGCKVIVSGSDASDNADRYLDAGADVVILGEGEMSLKELMTALERNETDLSTISGLAFRLNGKTMRTSRRNIMEDLDRIPFPAWDLVDMETYRKIWIDHHGYFSMNVATTRGCPFKCNWCAKPIYGNRYHSRSPKNVVDEIELLSTRYRADRFWFCDDIFGLTPGWIAEFRRLVSERRLNIRYKIQSRVDLLLDENTIEALGASGAETVWVGAESGSQHILDVMEKGTHIEQIYEATALLKKKNIKVAFFIQLGYPGETKEDIAKTIRMIVDLLPDDIGISVSYPLPGTKFYERVKGGMTAKTHWRDSDDLAMMFKSTYPPGYYRRLHRYIHGIYRLKKSKNLWRSFLADPFGRHSMNIKPALSAVLHAPKLAVDFLVLKKIERSN